MRIYDIQLPQEFEYIELYPLSDMHVGDPRFNSVKFHKFIQHILKAPHRFIIFNGDNANNAITSSVSNTYEETMPPREQKKYLKDELSCVKDRILICVAGNHEKRSAKNCDAHMVEDIAEYLKVPYEPEAAYLKLSVGKRTRGAHKNNKKIVYGIYVTHGWAGGRMPGSTLNNMERTSMNVFAHVYIFGHAHKKIAYKAAYYQPDFYNKNLREVEQLYVCSSSWINYGGYGLEKGFRPSSKGSVPIVLSGREFNAEAVV